MCLAGFDCKWCETIETCAKVRAAFPISGEEDIGKLTKAGRPRQAGSWWSYQAKRPVARVVNGVKMCSVADCNEPRLSSDSKCRAHRNEYYRRYYDAHLRTK
jgi:hypothetical protein